LGSPNIKFHKKIDQNHHSMFFFFFCLYYLPSLRAFSSIATKVAAALRVAAVAVAAVKSS